MSNSRISNAVVKKVSNQDEGEIIKCVSWHLEMTSGYLAEAKVQQAGE